MDIKQSELFDLSSSIFCILYCRLCIYFLLKPEEGFVECTFGVLWFVRIPAFLDFTFLEGTVCMLGFFVWRLVGVQEGEGHGMNLWGVLFSEAFRGELASGWNAITRFDDLCPPPGRIDF